MNVEELLAKASDSVSVRRAFGAAYEKDGLLIIPVALVAGGGGAGTGSPRRRNEATSPAGPPAESAAAGEAAQQEPAGPDTGGGFGGLVLPSGAYVVKGDEVRWVPALDVTVVVLASLSLVRMLVRTFSRRRRRR